MHSTPHSAAETLPESSPPVPDLAPSGAPSSALHPASGRACPPPTPTPTAHSADATDGALCWTLAWLEQTYRRCKHQDRCANEFGVTWRYQVPDRRRSDKAQGRCMCQRYCKAPIRRAESRGP